MISKVLLLINLLVFSANVLALNWDYVYEADRSPLAEDAITDSNCTASGAFNGTYTNIQNYTVSEGFITVDDSASFGANVFAAYDTSGMWSVTQPMTAEIKVKLDYFNPADDGITFLAVTNSQQSLGFKWWIDANSIEGLHTVGDPDADADIIYLDTTKWMTIRLVVPSGDWFSSPPVIYVQDSNGTLITDPNTGSPAVRGYAYFQTVDTKFIWGDTVSTQGEGSLTWDYVRWLIGGTYDFSTDVDEPNSCPCGRWGYLQTDINQDCVVDFADYAVVADSWVNCSNPDDSECMNLISNSIKWEYSYEADELPGIADVIKNQNQTAAGQWLGNAAVTSPTDVVSVSDGILTIEDLGNAGSYYIYADNTDGLWYGRNSTVELRMKLNNHTANNVVALQVTDGVNYYRWFLQESYISGNASGVSVNMTQMQTMRIAFPETGAAVLYINYNGAVYALPGLSGAYTLGARMIVGDVYSDESGTLSYDYVRWTNQGSYGLDTVITK